MTALDDEIARLAAPLPGISALLVFGSRARGNPRPESDLDVAVLPATEDPRARRCLQADLAVALADLAPEGRVDVILLDEAPVLLRQRTLETGRLVLCRDRRAWSDLRVATMREYGDQEWARRLYREGQIRRFERGEPNGRSGRALRSLERVGRLSR
jgi:predicted nucleotidyltransferase